MGRIGASARADRACALRAEPISVVSGTAASPLREEPLAIDLCCGLGGWTEGLLSTGWRVRGYDIEAHEYGDERYPAELVLRNVLEMHGSEIADANLIVASPPCTEYSYMAMPWSRGSRTIAELNAIFDACFRLQREASEAAGRHIPMVVENVKGAQPWVGRAAWNYGSFYLWGDLPALMPSANGGQKFNPDGTAHGPGSWFAIADSKNRGAKNTGSSWFNIGSPGQKVTGRNPVHALTAEGVKGSEGYERDHPEAFGWKKPNTSSGSKARKAASAKIAKIPLALSSHIARIYMPQRLAA
jgi:hypothetical protein